MEPERPQTEQDDDGTEYYGEPYGSRSSRFDWFWFAVTWLTVPLFVGYVAWRLLW